jgi:hypothetical protein
LRNYGLRVNFKEIEGSLCKIPEIKEFLDLIFNGKFRGPSPWCGGPHIASVHGRPWTEGAVVPRRRAARGRWSSPVLTGDGGGGRAGPGGAREVLTGDGGVAMRRCTRGSERRWLELIVRVKEGTNELGREGMRCGEGRGSYHPFIGAGGAPERGGRGE